MWLVQALAPQLENFAVIATKKLALRTLNGEMMVYIRKRESYW